jgi:hypothetical protein
MAAEHVPARLTVREREQALAELRRIDVTLTQLAQWLDDHGEQRAAATLDESWQRLAEAGWILMTAGGLKPQRISLNGATAAF